MNDTTRTCPKVQRCDIRSAGAAAAKNYACVSGMGQYFTCRFDPVFIRHVNVHDGNVGKMLTVLFDGFHSVGGLSDY